MAPPEINDDFIDMLRACTNAGVEFVVVGAHALAVHGIPRATGDIDLLVRPSSNNAARVITALQDFGAPLDAHNITATDFQTPGTVYQIGLPPRRIDLLTEISGVTFDEAWTSRVLTQIAGVEVSVLGREALIANKLAAGRDKDLLDAHMLQRQTSDG